MYTPVFRPSGRAASIFPFTPYPYPHYPYQPDCLGRRRRLNDLLERAEPVTFHSPPIGRPVSGRGGGGGLGGWSSARALQRPHCWCTSYLGRTYRQTAALATRAPPPNQASEMSLASLHPAEMHGHDQYHSLLHRSASIGSSLEELQSYFGAAASEPVLSIEELRLQLNSCFTCGVSWQEEHVSLDCRECGGYSLERPCPLCDGRCDSVWKRDLTTSHASGKARWEGSCALEGAASNSTTSAGEKTSRSPLDDETARLCVRLEKLSS
ncbi:protein pinocchio isoform X2 [Schistocerca cancellata]|uniref:protein pinocchio isoform X2 n=1 Tax=Schistocerca cancellata TaxID=274614 RepID=UPI002119220F|nr:protein pinocchio isoform X2 [Schistocerca cancellata]